MCEGLKTVRGSQYFRRFIRVSKALIRFFRAADLLDAAVGEPFRRVRVKARSHQGFPRRGVRRQRRLQVPLSAAHFLLFSMHSRAWLSSTGFSERLCFPAGSGALLESLSSFSRCGSRRTQSQP